MSKPFSIQDYKAKNSWKTGAVTKEVGDSTFKGGHNDIRKTNYDVNIVDGKLDLSTHKTVVTEGKAPINELSLSPIQGKFLKEIYHVSKKYQDKLDDSEMRKIFEVASSLYTD